MLQAMFTIHMSEEVMSNASKDASPPSESWSLEGLQDPVFELYRVRFPQVMAAYGDYEVEKTKQDIVYHLQFLEESVWAKDPALFIDYVVWARVLFKGLGIPMSWLQDSLLCIRDALGDSPSDGMAKEHIGKALMELQKEDADASLLKVSSSYHKEMKEYSDRLVEGRRQEARQVVMRMVDSGVSIKEIYMQVFQPAMYWIGWLWQNKRVSVAQEHYATAATNLIMAELYSRVAESPRIGRSLVATSVSGELHEMGIRMVADIFEMEGWDTYFLGASTPKDSVLEMVKAHEADVLAVSATMTFHILKVKELISHVRNAMGDKAPKIIVGGYPFKISEGLWKSVGADGFSEDAEAAVALANKLVEQR